MLVGGLAGVFTTVWFCWVLKLQRRFLLETDDPVHLVLFNLSISFEPLEGHIGCVLSLTFKFGFVANIDLHGQDSVPKDRSH